MKAFSLHTKIPNWVFTTSFSSYFPQKGALVPADPYSIPKCKVIQHGMLYIHQRHLPEFWVQQLVHRADSAYSWLSVLSLRYYFKCIYPTPVRSANIAIPNRYVNWSSHKHTMSLTKSKHKISSWTGMQTFLVTRTLNWTNNWRPAKWRGWIHKKFYILSYRHRTKKKHTRYFSGPAGCLNGWDCTLEASLFCSSTAKGQSR